MEILNQESNKTDLRYKSLLNSIIDYCYTAKIENGKVASIQHSRKCLILTGYSIDEFNADAELWDKIVYEKDHDRVKEELNKLLKGEITDFFEHRIYHKNGTVICLRHKLVPYYDNKGILIEYDGLVANITEWKKTEEALKLSELKYRRIFENTRDIYYQIDNEGTILDVSPSIKRYSGYSRQELIGKNISSILFYHSDKSTLLQEVLQKEEVLDFEIELITKSGDKIISSINSHLLHNSNGEVIGLEGSLRDITERKQSENRIKKLFQAVEQSPASIVITNVEGIIEYVNPRFTLVTGYNPEDVIGKKSRVLKAGKLKEGEFQKLWMSITKGNPWKGEYFNRKKTGETFWESILISPILDELGEVTNFLIITEDITEKKQVLKDLIEAKEKAEKGDRLKSQFLAQMSHEIRTPINSIINFTEILKEDLSAKRSNPKSAFDAIDISCNRIIRTIDMILRMSEIQTGSYDCSYRLINLYQEIIENVYSQFQDKAAQKKLDFFLTPPAKDIFVLGDQFSLENIFTNLIDNAITYTQEGKVEVQVFVNNNNNACVSVADTGIGISDNFLSDIFKPFIQEDQGYTRKFDGNGLGLALSKRYAELNHADILVESRKGKGSVFTVKFNQTTST